MILIGSHSPENLKMTLLKVLKQVSKPNYIEGAQMLLREQKDEKDSQIGIRVSNVVTSVDTRPVSKRRHCVDTRFDTAD